MRIPPLQLASPMYAMHYSGTLIVRSPDLTKSECEVTWSEALAMAVAGEIEALSTRGGRVKCFRRLPEQERPTADVIEESGIQAKKIPSGGFAAALQTYYEEESNGWRLPALKKARGERGRKNENYSFWGDRDGFNPRRFNPDTAFGHPKHCGPLVPPVSEAA